MKKKEIEKMIKIEMEKMRKSEKGKRNLEIGMEVLERMEKETGVKILIQGVVKGLLLLEKINGEEERRDLRHLFE